MYYTATLSGERLLPGCTSRSTDDFLAIASATPGAGMVVDVADIVAHAFGARVVWTP